MGSVIQIKRGTGSAVPTGLLDGELAINLDDNRFYFGSGSTVKNDLKVANFVADKAIITQLTSSIVSSSIIFSSGSNIFGDASGDTHTFVGDITASGNISGSNTTNLTIGGTLTAGTLDAAAVTDGLAAAIVAEIDNDEIPIAKLAEDAVTITAGDGLKTGGSVTLGDSVTLDVDVDVIAGVGLTADNTN